MKRLLLLCWLVLGCHAPPGLSDEDLARLTPTGGPEVTVFHAPGDVDGAAVAALQRRLDAVRDEVAGDLERDPPHAEVVLYAASATGEGAGPVRETRCLFFGDRIRFRFPFDPEQSELRDHLLGTFAHELTEATVLLQVTCLDPRLRWLHDGVAEWEAHRVLVGEAPETAARDLRGALEVLTVCRGEGVRAVDLGRWRQLAPELLRSGRLLPDGRPLQLDAVVESLRRLEEARASAPTDDAYGRGLAELHAIVRELAAPAPPWAEGEARPGHARFGDFVFYTAAFAVWLDVERSDPGAVQRALDALRRRRREGDHVLTVGEAWEVVREAAPQAGWELGVPLELAWVEGVLRRELEALER